MNSWQVLSLGFIAQLLFTCRFFFQWLASERAKKVLTPSLFWKFSLLGSLLLFLYGVLRNDLPIVVGQLLIYGIYIRNLQLQGNWNKIPGYFRLLICILPVIVLIAFSFSSNYNSEMWSSMSHIPLWLVILGLVAQIIFNLRFVVQWLVSENLKTSILPLPFWILSLTGSTLILLYAGFRKDPVLFVGHAAGIFIYARNISLSRNSYVSG